jgi:hypothetical protein
VATLDFDSPEVKRIVRALKAIDFELAYLALLTREGLKPLSRWEKPLDGGGLRLLEQIGLVAKQVHRTVKTGRVVTETVFSVSAGYIGLYESRFGNTAIDKSAATVRFEGFLFGFPPCCVDKYVRSPYAKNALACEEQKILFHWACPGCKITSVLLPAYLRVRASTEKC